MDIYPEYYKNYRSLILRLTIQIKLNFSHSLYFLKLHGLGAFCDDGSGYAFSLNKHVSLCNF